MPESTISGLDALKAIANALEQKDKYISWYKLNNAKDLDDPFSEVPKKLNRLIAEFNELTDAYQFFFDLYHNPPEPKVIIHEVEAKGENWGKPSLCQSCKEDIDTMNRNWERREKPVKIGSLIHLIAARTAPSKEAFLEAYPKLRDPYFGGLRLPN